MIRSPSHTRTRNRTINHIGRDRDAGPPPMKLVAPGSLVGLAIFRPQLATAAARGKPAMFGGGSGCAYAAGNSAANSSGVPHSRSRCSRALSRSSRARAPTVAR